MLSIGITHFSWTSFSPEITQQTGIILKYSSKLMKTGVIPDRLGLVNEQTSANWQYLLEATQPHGTGLFQNFSNWMKVGTFLKINKGVESCPAGSLQVLPSVESHNM